MRLGLSVVADEVVTLKGRPGPRKPKAARKAKQQESSIAVTDLAQLARCEQQMLLD